MIRIYLLAIVILTGQSAFGFLFKREKSESCRAKFVETKECWLDLLTTLRKIIPLVRNDSIPEVFRLTSEVRQWQKQCDRNMNQYSMCCKSEGDCSMLNALKVEHAGVAKEMNTFEWEFIAELFQAARRMKESGQKEYLEEIKAKIYNH